MIRRLPAAVLVCVALGAGCTSGDPESTATPVDPTPAAPSKPESGQGGADGAAERSGFEIPAELLDRVEEAGFDFVEVDYPPQPDGVPWPTADWPTGPLPPGVDRSAVDAAVKEAFAGGTGDADVIDAVLVVKDGRLVLEAYNGWDPEAKHNSWSVAKSITAALVGILVGRDELDIFEAASVPEWSEPGDPRRDITLDDLLRMSSGLEWEEDYVDPEGDVLTILAGDGQADRGGYTAAKPLEAEPDTHWEYSTGTADLIAREVAQRVGTGEEFVAWIQQNLFDPLGIPGAEHQLDGAGAINGGSWVNLRPVDFARFGYLFLRGGEWDGEQILPERWVDYSRMPTPTATEPVYGAQWWLTPGRPAEFWASGFNGQSITVVPEEDLVVVILSRTGTGRDEVLLSEIRSLFG